MTIQNPILSLFESDCVSRLNSTISHIAVGSGTTSPLPEQTQLTTETHREEIFESNITANSFTTSVFLDVTENNGNIVNEIGSFNASSSGTMVSRNLTTSSEKTSSKEFYYDVKFTISAINEEE